MKTLVFCSVLKFGLTHTWASVFITISNTAKLKGGVFSINLKYDTYGTPWWASRNTIWKPVIHLPFDFMKEDSKSQNGSAAQPRSPSTEQTGKSTNCLAGLISSSQETVRVGKPQVPIWTLAPRHRINQRLGVTGHKLELHCPNLAHWHLLDALCAFFFNLPPLEHGPIIPHWFFSPNFIEI